VIAVHILSLLAHGKGQAMTSDYLAGSVNTNPVVIRRLLTLLAHAGLVITQEGAKGGVKLAHPAEAINLLTVYQAVEADGLFSLHPQTPNPLCPVGGHIQAALVPSLDAAEKAMEKSLASNTIADVVGRL